MTNSISMHSDVLIEDIAHKQAEALALLKCLIEIPSISKDEVQTAAFIQQWLFERGITSTLVGNNVCAKNKYFDDNKPSVLLISHHDTVPPSKSYTRDPYSAEIIDGKLYGLGANDAGGALVSMIATFSYFYERADLPFNLLLCAAAEEEVSGKNGAELALTFFDAIDFAIVGEPTSMELAISEKGLMVCDCVAHGKTGHAARDEGDNAILKAVDDINWLNSYQFAQTSETLGDVKMSVTMIEAGVKHNVVPEKCHFVVDVRSTDAYGNEDVLHIMRQYMSSEITPRSLRIKASKTPLEHPLMQALLAKGINSYGSPTTSDQAIVNCPSVKFSPGDSKRSHSADEFIYVEQINEGVLFFITFFNELKDKPWQK
ncbi:MULTISPECIES: M20/M25/M40 family metallo-hydrolase [Cysteiniphilum]|uniref:M20/M25/M40 family metallo-hydrolase n=1 Tax=Cysteiniphilum TaxID=2056696 RepID=UPI001CE32B0A|nr:MULTISPECIES: M20/M25/M40 family metallo-hydrolase [Cysteiniphilum]